MEIRSISAVPATPRVGRIADTEPTSAVTAQTQAQGASAPISKSGSAEASPSQDVPTAPHEARYVRDDETNRLVLSVVDPGTGDVIAELPTKAALRAQAYAAGVAARSAAKPNVARLA